MISEHFHHGIEAGYILEGGMVEQAGKPITFASGTPIMNLRDVLHRGLQGNRSDKTIKLVTVHVVDKGKPLYDPGKK